MDEKSSGKSKFPAEPEASPSPSDADGKEAVGYGRPPRHSQFRKGQSGNPLGLRKRRKTFRSMLTDVMDRKVSVTENGKTRRVPASEAIMHRMRSEALRGDKATLKILLPLIVRYGDDTERAERLEDLLPEDLEILARYEKEARGAENDSNGDDAGEVERPRREDEEDES